MGGVISAYVLKNSGYKSFKFLVRTYMFFWNFLLKSFKFLVKTHTSFWNEFYSFIVIIINIIQLQFHIYNTPKLSELDGGFHLTSIRSSKMQLYLCIQVRFKAALALCLLSKNPLRNWRKIFGEENNVLLLCYYIILENCEPYTESTYIHLFCKDI